MELAVMGVPSAAGAYGVGLAHAPAAFRRAGLIEGLRGAGLNVVDLGDLPQVPYATDPLHPRRQNLDLVVAVALSVAGRVEAIAADDRVPLVLGGDCTLTLGVVSGLIRRQPDIALAYLDGDIDLSTPETTRSGILDAMGVAHMLGLEGAAPALRDIGGRTPLMEGRRIAAIGYDELELDGGRRELADLHGLRRFGRSVVEGRAAEMATAALAALADRDGLVVHFDVDVIDSTQLPLAQFPKFNQGLTVEDAMAVLEVLCAAPDVAAIVVTEANVDNDPDGRYVRRLVDGMVRAISANLDGDSGTGTLTRP